MSAHDSSRPKYTELFQADTSTLGNVFDFFTNG